MDAGLAGHAVEIWVYGDGGRGWKTYEPTGDEVGAGRATKYVRADHDSQLRRELADRIADLMARVDRVAWLWSKGSLGEPNGYLIPKNEFEEIELTLDEVAEFLRGESK